MKNQTLNSTRLNVEPKKKKAQAGNYTTLEPIVVLPSPTQDWSENAFDDRSTESSADNASDTSSSKKRPLHQCEKLFLKALQDRHGFELRTINCSDRCKKTSTGSSYHQIACMDNDRIYLLHESNIR